MNHIAQSGAFNPIITEPLFATVDLRFLKVLTIYGHGGHLGHVTIYINFRPPVPRRLNIKFGFDWPSGFSVEDV